MPRFMRFFKKLQSSKTLTIQSSKPPELYNPRPQSTGAAVLSLQDLPGLHDLQYVFPVERFILGVTQIFEECEKNRETL